MMDQLRVDIDVEGINALTETEFGIFETSESTAFIDGESTAAATWI